MAVSVNTEAVLPPPGILRPKGGVSKAIGTQKRKHLLSQMLSFPICVDGKDVPIVAPVFTKCEPVQRAAFGSEEQQNE